MTDINTLITTNFQENTTYLESYHPKVFEKIVALESAIANNHYQEKYELVYENENFDVLEKSTETTLYAGKSLNYSSLAEKSVNYKYDDNVFETFHKRVISDDDLKIYTQQEPFMDHMSGFAEILHYIQNHSVDIQELSHIEKFIFFGTGLGLHINSIHKKISSKIYFIIENDLELFRLSLFTMNYKEMSLKSKLIFSIFETEEEFSITATDFLETDYQYNQYIKYFHMLNHSEDKQIKIHQLISSQPHLTFYYHTMLQHYTRPVEYLLSDYRFLNKTLTFNNKHLRDKPFLLLAAGPSLEKNREWLKNNHENFVIVAVAATLPFLEKEGVSPDVIIQLDGHLHSIEHFKRLNSLSFIQNSICIFSDKVPSNIIDQLQKDKLFFFENATKYKNNSFKPTAFCVGSISLQILLLLQIKEIYLLGLDLAIDKETGLTHSSSHYNPRTISVEEASDSNDSLEYKTNLKEISGNNSKTVLTTQHFLVSVENINQFMKFLKRDNQTIINLSDGAKFLNTIPKQCSEINLLDSLEKEKIVSNIQKTCMKNSSIGLSSAELKSLQNKLLQAKELKEIFLNHLELNVSSIEKYLQELQRISAIILKKESLQEYELNRILEAYFRYIMPFIHNFLSQKSTTQKDIITIGELFSKHIIDVIDFYYEALFEV